MRLGFLVWSLIIVGCSPTAAPPALTGPAAGDGEEVRYNAAQALARRGSAKLNDTVVQELFKEMLDEEQQLRSFRVKLKDGREVSNPVGARSTVLGAIRALDEYKTKAASADLSMYRPALEKLSTSANSALKQEAQRLLERMK